ncbi:MAG: hypothetical protein F6K03_07290, partial [Kamptonema sp. SIO4C4]|nr:hypothetical protein [Kamptonema sp. SIO4C4]
AVIGSGGTALAQSPLPTCQPPESGEYLLLIYTPDLEAQETLQEGLPEEISLAFCRYEEQAVGRVSGLSRLSDAQRLGQYVQNTLGLSGAIAQSEQRLLETTEVESTTTEPTPPATPPQPTAQIPPASETLTYNPRPLSTGYAVLVNYFNNPQVANQIQATTNQEVGLVVYFGRPYLLANYTDNVETASGMLQELSDRGFSAMMVNSEQVILLTPQVSD